MTFTKRNLNQKSLFIKKQKPLFQEAEKKPWFALSKKNDKKIDLKKSLISENPRAMPPRSPLKRPNTPKKKNIFLRIFKWIFWTCFWIGLISGLCVLGWIGYTVSKAPSLETLDNTSFAQSSVIYDSTGERVLYELVGDEGREYVTIDQISQPMKDAILAAEDADFYYHNGYDLWGIGGAVIDTLKGSPRGASTITQQLIKMVIFSQGEENIQERIERKIKEISLARELEAEYSKDKILELYLNKVPFGGSTYGIQKASKTFFDKDASELDIAESALLAGLPQAPSRYQKVTKSYIDMSQEEMDQLDIENYLDFQSRENAINNTFVRGVFGQQWNFSNGKVGYIPGRVDFVLAQMLEKDFITEEEYNKARADLDKIEFKAARIGIEAPHFVFYAEQELTDILTEIYGDDYKNIIHSEGLQIYTTVDTALQNNVQRIIQEYGEKNEAYSIRNGAAVVLDSKTGAIKAMVGSRDYFATELNDHDFDGQVNVITSRRQPGSTFKPFVYGAAFELAGLAPATVLMDMETDLSLNPSQKYIPRNYDGKYNGPVSIRSALGNSYNIPAVKTGIIVGLDKAEDFVRKMGLNMVEEVGFFKDKPSFSLGAPTVQPLEMGGAFASFANDGKKIEPFSITKITDARGKIIFERDLEKPGEQIYSPETAFLITDILADESGDARPKYWNDYLSLPGGRPAAAKTGTSTGVIKEENGKRVTKPHDVWTIGYTPQFTTVVWMGNNKGWEGNPKGFLRNDASGLTNAAKPWRDIMIEAHKDLEIEKFTRPEGIKVVDVSKLTGKRAGKGFPSGFITKGFFNVKHLPDKNKYDTSIRTVQLETESKLLPNEFTPETAKATFYYIELHSFFPKNKKWEDPVRKWLANNSSALASKMGIGNLIAYVPTQTTPLYNEETEGNKPQIRFISPANMGIVSPPRISVELAPNANNGIREILIYWDGKLLARKSESPWVFTIPLETAAVGSLHTLSAEIEDRLGYKSESSIQVKVGEDNVPPSVAFQYPKNNEVLIAGNLANVSIDAIDRNSAIKSVEFYLDGNLIKSMTSRPYQFSWLVDGNDGDHNLQALVSDTAGNTSEDSVRFSIKGSTAPQDIIEDTPEPNIREETSNTIIQTDITPKDTTPIPTPSKSNQQEKVLAVLSPSSGETITGSIGVRFSVPIRMRVPGVSLQVYARQVGGKKSQIYSIAGTSVPDSGEISFSWTPAEKAEYSLYVQVVGNVNDFSSKVRVIAQ